MDVRRLRNLLIVGVALILFLAALVFTSSWGFRKAKQELLQPKEEVVDVAALVTRVRELSRLETASMRVVHVGTIRQTYEMVPDALGGDEITLLATGDVVAGVDLSRLTEADAIREADGSVTLRLPKAQVFHTRVDNKETRVVARKTGVLRRADVNLETRARQHAEAMIRNEAMKKGIVGLADRNAEQKLAEFLRVVGFKRVRFVRVPSAPPRPLEGG